MTVKKATDKIKKKKITRPPSDALFKKIMENKVAAQEFLEYYLQSEFKELIDLSKLKVEKESYVDKNLKRNSSDIVYLVQTRDNEEAFVYSSLKRGVEKIAREQSLFQSAKGTTTKF